ncbi:YhgE/Pip domain-containing protein [Gulosibacter molinativorax]|uniref:YhgE/Pip domain-containing protein n=1 Tax=Gulosibacter molinativorax TaxID=256821 RepID=A0ABT7CBQ0_9MICO|nr:YhgE/Pip domain-containing protein [Gulosibacter molinativorax]MDJ1372621.1 YhgE/Pip domain-containing protein [Gulosibacter molinativorax]QUY62595.1 Hypotetical protein [Gulosibacter molinativorax]
MSASTRPGQHAASFKGSRIRNLLVAIAVPLVLVAVYFAALGGANDRAGAIPALIVNNDEMATQANNDGTETQVVAGRLLVSWFTNPENVDQFDWQLASQETADAALKSGDAYVVLTLPSDFSASIVSLSGGDPRSARVEIATSQSKDWVTGAVAQDVFDGLTAQFGQTVTNMVAVGLADGLNESADGLQQAADGATELADGIGQVDDGFATFLDGSEQLADGTGQAHDGAIEFSDGVGTFRDGLGTYTDGVGTYVDGVGSYVDGVSQYTDGVGEYVGGVDQFAGGVQDLASGVSQLSDGTEGLQDAADELRGVADQFDEYAPQIEDAVSQLEQLAPLLGGISSVDPSELTTYCDDLEAVDPASAQACRDAVDQVVDAIDTSGIDLGSVEGDLSDAIDQLGGISSAGDGLGQLADGITQYTDGVSQLNDGASQLSDAADDIISGGEQLTGASDDLSTGGEQLVSGGEDLVTGGSSLDDGASQLGDGASALADGLAEIVDGQTQLNEGGATLGDGIGELEDGARTMAKALQDGADQAKSAIGDPEAFAQVVSEPVVSETVNQHDPTYGGVLGAIGLAVGIWLAALITALRRRIVSEDALTSSASNATIFLSASRRLVVPVGIVAAVLSLVPHLFLGAPWSGFLGTLGFALLATLSFSAVHLLLATVSSRRSAAVWSVALLLLQLMFVRGFFPLEFAAPWVQPLSGFMPISQVVMGLQAIYAGGSAGTVFGAAAGLALIGLFALALALVAIVRRRRAVVVV